MKVTIRYSSRTEIFTTRDLLESEDIEHDLDNVEMDLTISGLSSLIKEPGEFDLFVDGANVGSIPVNGARIAQIEEE